MRKQDAAKDYLGREVSDSEVEMELGNIGVGQ
jgi:hypothetical protein